MYKPQTIEQFKVYQFMREQFEMDAVILSPLSRHSLMLEDMTGEKIAFAYKDGCVQEVPVPKQISQQEAKKYVRSIKRNAALPLIHNWKEATRWWLNTPNPLTYQQALGLSDKLYRHFLTQPMLDEKKMIRLAQSGLVTELEFLDMRLWYCLNRPRRWILIESGVCGTTLLYALVVDFLGDNETNYKFTVKDEDYCRSHSLPYPYE